MQLYQPKALLNWGTIMSADSCCVFLRFLIWAVWCINSQTSKNYLILISRDFFHTKKTKRFCIILCYSISTINFWFFLIKGIKIVLIRVYFNCNLCILTLISLIYLKSKDLQIHCNIIAVFFLLLVQQDAFSIYRFYYQL